MMANIAKSTYLDLCARTLLSIKALQILKKKRLKPLEAQGESFREVWHRHFDAGFFLTIIIHLCFGLFFLRFQFLLDTWMKQSDFQRLSTSISSYNPQCKDLLKNLILNNLHKVRELLVCQGKKEKYINTHLPHFPIPILANSWFRTRSTAVSIKYIYLLM